MITPPAPPPRKSHRLRNWLIGIGVAIIALIGGIAGCAALVGNAVNQAANPNSVSSHSPAHTSPSAQANTPSTPSTPTPSGPEALQLGAPAFISQNGTQAATITINKRIVTSRPIDQFSDGPQNGYFVSVRVNVSAASGLTNGFDINPFDFYALTGTTHYDEGDGNAYEGPHNGSELSATTLNARETATGWLLFDLPSRHGKIVYAPNLDGQPLAYWKF